MTEDLQVVVESAGGVERPNGAIAPWWHTAAVLAILGMWAAMSYGRSAAARSEHHAALYVSTIMMEWMLMGAVVGGVYRRRQFFLEAEGRGSRSWMADMGIGAALYVGVFLLFALVAGATFLVRHKHSFDSSVVKAMAPQGATEVLLWVGLSLSAGICEELVFRGYLLQQAIAWTRRAGCSIQAARVIAVVSTSLLFGSLHLYEGTGGALLIVLLGAVYAASALLLRNLRAVIVAHVLQDFIAGMMLMALRHRGM